LANRQITAVGLRVDQRIGCRITCVDKVRKYVADDTGRVQPYEKLVLATGSVPYVPAVRGINLPGVVTLQDSEDMCRALASHANSHHTVVLGGGSLGLKAAYALNRAETHVTVVERSDRLLARHLDEAGAMRLNSRLGELGIDVVTGDGLREVLGTRRVRGVRLSSGRELVCDTLAIAAGTRPNMQLARQIGLALRRGIQVDDRMRTRTPDIYAIGACTEHRGRLYGQLRPRLEQAVVAAADISGKESCFTGSIPVFRSQVARADVFSMGPVGAAESRHYGRTHLYCDDQKLIYRKLLVRRNRLEGAIGVGEWPETDRVEAAIRRSAVLWPMEIMRFRRSGRLWSR
jgi:nitrite reductase (NADH) large subunit